ncbi:MAG: DUF3540 domain-containing protein [Deltaproteobacteria bacterium]|nr:DUF3540 domain-containing protein [Deltaproteobacteria bacterium]
MNNIIALKRDSLPREASLLYARVLEKDGDGYSVRLENGAVVAARRAGGCLLAPETGDEVLIADNGECAFILSVLTSPGDTGRITLPDKSTIEGGEITFTASQGVAMEAPRISLTGILGEVRFTGLSLLSQWCDVRIRKIVAVVEIWDRVIGRLTERIRDSYRWIENTEHTTAGRIRTIVKKRFFLSAKNASLNAEEEVKLDGKKIHIG